MKGDAGDFGPARRCGRRRGLGRRGRRGRPPRLRLRRAAVAGGRLWSRGMLMAMEENDSRSRLAIPFFCQIWLDVSSDALSFSEIFWERERPSVVIRKLPQFRQMYANTLAIRNRFERKFNFFIADNLRNTVKNLQMLSLERCKGMLIL